MATTLSPEDMPANGSCLMPEVDPMVAPAAATIGLWYSAGID